MQRRLHVCLARGVRDEHEARIVAEAFLLRRADRDVVRREHAGDRVEHAGAVGDLERDVVLGARLVDRQHAGALEHPDRRVRAFAQVARRVDDVAEHRARSRAPARAASVEHERADRVTLDEHRVVAVAHTRERMRDRHHRRVHTHRERAVVEPLGDGEQLHDVAEPRGERRCRRR